MNYVAPTFDFQQGDELCFTTSPSFPTSTSNSATIPQQHLVSDILLTRTSSPLLLDDTYGVHPTRPPNPLDANNNHGTTNKRKITHRDVERQRRHEMALLYASLRTHLPAESLKGKRSISDNMYEAANYIKQQEEKIKQLTEKRDALRRVMASSSSPSNSGYSSICRILSLPDVSVQSCYAGFEVVIRSRTDDEVPLSSLVAALMEEGLDVVSLVSTAINDKSFCAVHCRVKAGDVGQVDLGGLKEKLLDAMLYSD